MRTYFTRTNFRDEITFDLTGRCPWERIYSGEN